jgi:hypothetical protein
MVGALEWALGQGGSIPYGELAFDGRRLEMLRELLSQLVALDFRGVVRLESYLGEFCLVQDGAGGYELPRGAMPLERCEFIGHPLDDSDLVSDRQSVAFANFLATSPLVNEAGIDVQIVAHDRTRNSRRAQFPAGVRTAGEWNRIAERNNRVEFVLLPSTP